jgi:lysozyme family protein
MSDFRITIENLVPIEGGYVNDPDDPGGETKYGITKRSYPNLDIKNLSLDDAKVIYERDFWNRYHINLINDQNLATQVFYAVINMGATDAVIRLQMAVNRCLTPLVDIDGKLGTATLDAINRPPSVDRIPWVCDKFRIELIKFYNDRVHGDHNLKYLHGWITRALR